MAPKERLRIKDMMVGETRVYNWRTENFKSHKQMYHHIGNRCSMLKRTSPMEFSMMTMPEEKVLVRRHK